MKQQSHTVNEQRLLHYHRWCATQHPDIAGAVCYYTDTTLGVSQHRSPTSMQRHKSTPESQPQDSHIHPRVVSNPANLTPHVFQDNNNRTLTYDATNNTSRTLRPVEPAFPPRRAVRSIPTDDLSGTSRYVVQRQGRSPSMQLQRRQPLQPAVQASVPAESWNRDGNPIGGLRSPDSQVRGDIYLPTFGVDQTVVTDANTSTVFTQPGTLENPTS